MRAILSPFCPALAAIAAAALLGGAYHVRADDDEPPRRPRLPLALIAGLDTPVGLVGLSLGVESAGGWGLGLAGGISDQRPGGLHDHLAIQGRAPLWRRCRFESGLVLSLARGTRERQQTAAPYARWEWRPGHRGDVVASGRYRFAGGAVRLDAGIGYLLDQPRCVQGGPACTATRPAPGTFAPSLALAAELDLLPAEASPAIEESSERAPLRWDFRESNTWVGPTALTLPAGSVRITLYELVLPEIAVGVTDRWQLSGGVGYLPPAGGLELLFKGELKYRLVDAGRFHLAPVAAALGGTGQYDSGGIAAGAGVAASVCLGLSCSSLVSLAVLAGALYSNPDEGESSWTPGLLVTPSLIIALHEKVKLVGEVYLPSDALENPSPALLVRFAFRRFGLELGAARAGPGEIFPIASLSWRVR